MIDRLKYYYRIVPAYLGKGTSHVTFWRETPAANPRCSFERLGAYYMTFFDKAIYEGPFDRSGIPLLDYRGVIGEQYNPIAISQYGLGNFNLFEEDGDAGRLQIAKRQADWLVTHLEPNKQGVPVWNHHFDWEYREKIQAPWYSGLAQGSGISLLLRVYDATGNASYLEAARDALISMRHTMLEGGVVYVDEQGDPWIEEAIVEPPTHILNGFLWALWGIWDYYLATGDVEAKVMFSRFVETLEKNLHRFDAGYWSLYELAGLRMKMLASPFYHALHCVQLGIMARMSGKDIFEHYAAKWEGYATKRLNRYRALPYKAIFKLVHY